LLEHHVADYDDITRTVPGVGFQAGPGPGLDNIEIRGGAEAASVEGTVAPVSAAAAMTGANANSAQNCAPRARRPRAVKISTHKHPL
jgi:hypothetical protein